MLWLPDALGTRPLFWFRHECSGYRMLWEHEGYNPPPPPTPTQSSETPQNSVRKSPRVQICVDYIYIYIYLSIHIYISIHRYTQAAGLVYHRTKTNYQAMALASPKRSSLYIFMQRTPLQCLMLQFKHLTPKNRGRQTRRTS